VSAPVTLRIGHRNPESEITFLGRRNIGSDAVQVVGAVFSIGPDGAARDRIERVVAQVSLCASGFLAHESNGLELGEQIVRGSIDVEHSADPDAAAVLCSQQRLVRLDMGIVVCDADGGDAWSQRGLVGDRADLLSVNEDPRRKRPKRLAIFSTRH
jgi:hypothetical protein